MMSTVPNSIWTPGCLAGCLISSSSYRWILGGWPRTTKDNINNWDSNIFIVRDQVVSAGWMGGRQRICLIHNS